MASGFWDRLLTVGKDRQFTSLSEALLSIPPKAGRVLLKVCSELIQDIDATVPTDRGIFKLKITGFDEEPKTIDFEGCSFFANGIPLEIDSGISLKNCFLFGGGKAEGGKTVSFPVAGIVLKGNADQVFGGGLAVGPDSVSAVKDIDITLLGGRADELYGGGYGVQGGNVHSDRIKVRMDRDSMVYGNLYGGSCLPGPGSRASIQEIVLHLSGQIFGNVFLGGYAAFGSAIRVEESIQFNSADAVFYHEIESVRTVGRMSAVSIPKITGRISEEYKNQLKITNSGIALISKNDPIELPAASETAGAGTKPAPTQPAPEKRPGPAGSGTKGTAGSLAVSQPKVPVVPKPGSEAAGKTVTQPSSRPSVSQGSPMPPQASVQPAPRQGTGSPAVQPAPKGKPEPVHVPANASAGLPQWEGHTPGPANAPVRSAYEPKKKSPLRTILIILIIVGVLWLAGRIVRSLNAPAPAPKPKVHTIITNTPTELPNAEVEAVVSTAAAFPEAKDPAGTTIAVVIAPPAASQTPAPVPTDMAVPTAVPGSAAASVPTRTAVPVPTNTEAAALLIGSKPTAIPTETAAIPLLIGSTPTSIQTETGGDALLLPKAGVIRAEGSSGGTFLYPNAEMTPDYVVRWLNNGTEVEILDGPVISSYTEWYWIRLPQYSQSGWVPAEFVALRAGDGE